MTNCKPIQTPLPTKFPSDHTLQQPFHQPALFHQLVGSLQYMSTIRPDIVFAVNKLCQHMHQPLLLHYQLLKLLLRYMQGTIDYSLLLPKIDLVLTAFSDSDWAGDVIDRKSTTGYCIFLGQALVSWTVKKQNTVAGSSTEADDHSLAAVAADIIWIRCLCIDFKIPQQPTPLYCDNIYAMSIATNPIFHARTKHIEIDHHFVRNNIQAKHIPVHHIATEDQPADLFTKALHVSKHLIIRTKLMVVPPISLRVGVKEECNTPASTHSKQERLPASAADTAELALATASFM
ncbi:putative mitochondrial protein [Dendrobium catenatum]|uniref:Putative mitochondrial protein n=1 Tax=Dendrobium catenatum TaxID=906689 RepID=A0A2I0XDU0_9ASPA|nr:putative mitochondrial protein [Dendrobium catenatum]